MSDDDAGGAFTRRATVRGEGGRDVVLAVLVRGDSAVE